MPNLLTNLRLLGILALDSDGDAVFIPFKQMIGLSGITEAGASGIIDPLTPDQDRIHKETKKDLSLSGVLKKAGGQ